MKLLYKLGSYLIFIRKAFSRPEKRSVYTKEVIVEFEKLGLNSIVLVVIISFFIGAVLTLSLIHIYTLYEKHYCSSGSNNAFSM